MRQGPSFFPCRTAAYGVAPVPRAGRGKRFEESLRTIRELFKGESLIPGTRAIGPAPVRPGGPEILLGSNGLKALRRAGEFADGAVTWSFGADPEEARRIRELARDRLFLMPGVGNQGGDIATAIRELKRY